MFHDPIQQRFLETNVVTCLLTFNPLVTEDLFAFSEKFFVKERFFNEVRVLVCCDRHGSGISRKTNIPSRRASFHKRWWGLCSMARRIRVCLPVRCAKGARDLQKLLRNRVFRIAHRDRAAAIARLSSWHVDRNL